MQNKLNNKPNNEKITEEALRTQRDEIHLSLRKEKLNDFMKGLRFKRLLTLQNENIDYEKEMLIDIKKLEEKLPENFISSFDEYDEKLQILSEFLNMNFCSINHINYEEQDIIYFSLYKLEEYCDEFEEKELYSAKNNEFLENALYSLEKMLSEKKDDLVIVNTILNIFISFSCDSEFLRKRMISAKLWDQLDEINNTINNPKILANIIWIYKNIIESDEIGYKILYEHKLRDTLIRLLISIAKNIGDNKFDDLKFEEINIPFEFILHLFGLRFSTYHNELKDIYPHIISIFLNYENALINKKLDMQLNEVNIIKTFGNILKILRYIIIRVKEDDHILKDFYGYYFVVAFMNYLKFLIDNYFYNRKFIQIDNDFKYDLLREVISIYSIFGNLFRIGSERDISSFQKEGFLIVSEKLLTVLYEVENMLPEIIDVILFAVSNYFTTIDQIEEFLKLGSFPNLVNNLFIKYNKEDDIVNDIQFIMINCFAVGQGTDSTLETINYFYNININFILEAGKEDGQKRDQCLVNSFHLINRFNNYLAEKSLLKDKINELVNMGYFEFIENMLFKSHSEELNKQIEINKKFIEYI